jgi:UDP-galactopyranose mutase
MNKQKVAIIGAGIAGLSAAYHLQNTNYILFEKEYRVGGLCRSEVIDGFTFDYAIHAIYSNDEYASKLIKEVLLKGNLNSQIRESWIYSKGTYTEYPFQAHTYGLPVEVIKECIIGLIEAKYENEYSDEPKNFRDWLYRTFGAGIAEHFMIPYNRKQWAIDPELMDYNWTAKRIPIPKMEEVLDGALRRPQKKFGANNKFWYPVEGGIEVLPRGFLPYVRNIELNSKVTMVFVDRKEVQIDCKDTISYDYLISTLPLSVVVNLLDNAPQKIINAAAELEYNTIYAAILGVNRENISDFHWVYYPEDDYIFHRISFPMNFAESNAPNGKSSIMAEISSSRYKKVNYNTLIDDTIRDLKKAKVLQDNDEILVADILTLSPAYVIYTFNRHENVTQIHEFLEQNDIYSCGRFGEWEYLNMDGAILSGKKVVEKLLRN